jgi:hypothetical protein
MERSATFEWRAPPLGALNEELAVFDDGTAWLLAVRPRTSPAAIGAYRCSLPPDDARLLAGAGPGPVVFTQPADSAVFTAAERAAAAALHTPVAVVEFRARATATSVSLYAIASGERALPFVLDVAASAVHVRAGGVEVDGVPFPELQTGFMTAEAEGLGGLGRSAGIPPGAYGAIAFDLALPAGDEVVLSVAGSVAQALPDQIVPVAFLATTEPVSLG